ncbi:alpha/beta hydrolase [Bradyrhizobium sp. IC3069]|uniref:alpha/beta hydrolase n=1 Tax=Bradyrhizobium TaxID=374 RepID=UPI001CD46A70|nr:MULTISPECIES: alpha/beta hydrolase [Bradyrhizobium]MCA1365368.1 alpha/beta hydrolase [Bradyrhizobium sp. IC4059]MCA1522871.1 alpha/beta hydrolase [Bradyrhizobium sp. IC3069]MCA1529418.1 alpha/beta hydrolase [Bradyrhizobium yuanmingense]MCA1550101.1 alpha/beta hydrolase [Bradyrhizobium sp. BRP19]
MQTLDLAAPPAEKAELDLQLSPSRSSLHVPAIFGQWQALSEKARQQSGSAAFLNLPYGKKTRQRLDVFTNGDRKGAQLRPVHVFIHGGFWQEGSKDDFHFLGPAFVKAGWIYIAAGYSLAPTVSLSEIVAEIREAAGYVRARAADFGGDPARIVVSGHSAGGHLAACLALAGEEEQKLAGIVAISGVFDLHPIRQSYVNDAINIGDDEARLLSPALRAPIPGTVGRVLVGALESPEFIRQSRLLVQNWGNACGSLSYSTIAGADHFSILLDLTDPTSQAFRAVAGVVDTAA